MKKFNKSITTIILALIISAGSIHIGVMEVLASTEMLPTITIGDSAPMTRDEFMEWREHNGFRYFKIGAEILPATIFFDGHTGKAFTYGELNDIILTVYLIPGAVSNGRILSVNDTPAVDLHEVSQTARVTSPVLFDDITPILFSDEELTAMIERVPNEGPMETISAITLQNRRITESELESWINEYNEMGGASAFELGVVREVNRVRVEHGLQPLALSPALMMSSRFKTQEFADLQYYNHRSIVHGSVSESAGIFGYNGGVGENMTRTGSNGEVRFVTTPDRVVRGMLQSSKGHRELLLNPNLKSVGFGVSFSPNSRGANGNMSHMFYYVTQFGF